MEKIDLLNDIVASLNATSIEFVKRNEAIVHTHTHPLRVRFYRTLINGVAEWGWEVVPHSA